MASNSSFFEAFSSQGLWVIRTGRKIWAEALRLASDLWGTLQGKAATDCNLLLLIASKKNELFVRACVFCSLEPVTCGALWWHWRKR